MLDVATMEAIMSPREFHGGFAMGILMDGVMGCRTSGGFILFCYDVFFGVCVWVFTAPSCPPSHHVKTKPMPMLLIETNVRKTYVIATRDVFRGLEGPVLFSLTKKGPKMSQLCRRCFCTRRARACASYRSIIGTIGNPFWLGPRRSKAQNKRPCRHGPGRSPCLEL